MTAWNFSIGNLARRAPRAPAAVSPAVEDSVLPLTNLANDYPDEQAAFTWRGDGVYEADLDLNLLAEESERADAPTGWTDLLNLLAGTPGLPSNPPDWGNYGGRNPALRFFRPVVQEIDVMPGEAVKLSCSIRWPAAAAGATGVRVRVVDTSTGKGWDGAAWSDGGVLDQQTIADTWKDIAEEIAADEARTERARYQVIFEPIAAAFDATTFCYASANGAAGSPALFAEADLAAVIGHNLPADATVSLGALSLTPVQPSFYATGAAAFTQVWRLSIAMPSGNQPRPIIGEVWVGLQRSLIIGAPVLPIDISESSPGQLQVEGARGRVDVVGEDAYPVRKLELAFKARTDAAYQQMRDGISRLTRFGADPLLILPDADFEGAGILYHGRLGNDVTYSRETPGSGSGGAQTLRSFSLPFAESPFAAR